MRYKAESICLCYHYSKLCNLKKLINKIYLDWKYSYQTLIDKEECHMEIIDSLTMVSFI